MPLHYILWTFDGALPYPVLVTSWVLGCLSTENTDKWIDSALRFNNSKSFLLLTSLIILQVSPSLIGYIIIVLKFLPVLSGPSSRSTISDNELSLHWYSLPYHFSPWTASLFSSLCCTCGSNNFSLHHSYDLMSSSIDYIFMKSLDKCVVTIINIPSSSRISIEFMMRNTILAPRWFELSSTTFLPSPTQTCSYNFGNTSFLTCRWIVAEPVGHTLIFSLLKLYDLFSKLFPMDPLCIQSLTFPWWPCQHYPEACVWYSVNPQEHLGAQC